MRTSPLCEALASLYESRKLFRYLLFVLAVNSTSSLGKKLKKASVKCCLDGPWSCLTPTAHIPARRILQS